jgi:hypothetical protein
MGSWWEKGLAKMEKRGSGVAVLKIDNEHAWYE